MVHKRLEAAEARLIQLQAIDVASRIDEKKYSGLVSDFAQLTGLELESDSAVTKGEATAQVGRLVDSVIRSLKQEGALSRFQGSYLLFQSVTPGQRQVVGPFLSIDFELNLEGRFFALPEFLVLLSRIAREEQCTISVGELQVSSKVPGGRSGELQIVLPLRAYFLER
jgi:hypothetical protein